MSPLRKWFTCTPVRFVGDIRFFSRDSGLLCKGFQQIGVDCRAIMPGPAMESDLCEDLVRTNYRNLEDAAWWRSLGGEGVVLYGWGAGKYAAIAKAIKEADLFLVSHMDTAGMLGIFNGTVEYAKSIYSVCMGESNGKLQAFTRFATKLAYGATLGIVTNDLRRAGHLRQADLIGAITPIAVERIRKVCKIYGGSALADRVRLIPHPNATLMRYDPQIPKENLVVAVGRWDDAHVKGTDLLMKSLEKLTALSDELSVEIYGIIPAGMRAWHASLPASVGARVKLPGIVSNESLAKALQRARISLCTSLREGYHTVSAEALCCGCSIVGPDVAEIPSMQWFTTDDCGRMAQRTPEALATAVAEELEAWRSGKRDARQISTSWCDRLHAPRIAERILHMADPQELRN